jgi:hypothetical protein
MQLWELIPKVDRPDAQVLVTLPNYETEYVDGFPYQEFRFVATETPRAVLMPAGFPHTRYRYRPRQIGTHLWLHRTPPGGTLEQGAFVALSLPDSVPLLPLTDGRPLPSAVTPLSIALPEDGEEQAGLTAIKRALDRLPPRNRCLRVLLDATNGIAEASSGEPDLARGWLLDDVLRAAEERHTGVVLRLPAPPGPDLAALHATLHVYVCRCAPMGALAAWELSAPPAIAEAACRFLRSYDPYHPVILDEGENHAGPAPRRSAPSE